MKIGLITSSFNNYGSRLQNLASILIYKEKYPNSKIYTIIPTLKYKIVDIPFFGKLFSFFYLRFKFKGKINRNNKLLNYKLVYIESYNLEHLKKLNKKFDLFIIGSDRIWEHVDVDYNFKFAMFTKNKICNAPSLIGDSIYKNRKIYSLCLPSFECLNVRESKIAKIINDEYKLKCDTLNDPTLRLGGDKWNSLCSKSIKSSHHEYIVLYIIGSNEQYKNSINSISNKLKSNIITIFNENNGNHRFQYTPLEFISIINNSDGIITNSFHGACFAKIFNKKLKILKYSDKKTLDDRFDIFNNYDSIFDEL